jgi:hypothetical protein
LPKPLRDHRRGVQVPSFPCVLQGADALTIISSVAFISGDVRELPWGGCVTRSPPAPPGGRLCQWPRARRGSAPPPCVLLFGHSRTRVVGQQPVVADAPSCPFCCCSSPQQLRAKKTRCGCGRCLPLPVSAMAKWVGAKLRCLPAACGMAAWGAWVHGCWVYQPPLARLASYSS